VRWGEPWITKRERYRAPQGTAWVDWFAWYPVCVDGGRYVWLEPVQWRYWDGMTYNLPEYRAASPKQPGAK
jgi:hypothetical protein